MTAAYREAAKRWHPDRAVLAVTDRRLLWLLDDAVARRVHSLRFAAVSAVEQQLRRIPWSGASATR